MNKNILSVLLSFAVLIFFSFNVIAPINAAPFGNFIVFNGGTVNSQIQNTTSPSQFYMEIWIKPTSVSGIRHIMTISDSQNQVNYQVGINGSSLSLFYRFGNSSQRSIVTGNISENIWQKISVSIDSSSTKMFINDLQISSFSGAATLKPVGPKITLGTSFAGEMDQFRLILDQANLIMWNFDQNRGETLVADSSGNNLNGALTGGDSKIHYFGILPTPTRFALPKLPAIRRISPGVFPTSQPQPTSFEPSPTSALGQVGIRFDRHQFPR